MSSSCLPRSGVAAIDDAHADLTKRLAELLLLWRQGHDVTVLLDKVRQLRNSMACHFMEEGRIFHQYRIEAPGHAEQHHAILGRVDRLIGDHHLHGQPNNWYYLLEQLQADLFGHEIVEDGRHFPLRPLTAD